MKSKHPFTVVSSFALLVSACSGAGDLGEPENEASNDGSTEAISVGDGLSSETEQAFVVCDENGNRYASEEDAVAAGLSEAQYGATYCQYFEDSEPAKTTASNQSVQPCLEAVAKQVGTDEVSLIRVEQSEAATGVYVNVVGAEAPWLCTAWGTDVAGVMYTGDEGAL